MSICMTKHPKLAKKFRLLYQLKASPEISNNRQLGDKLGLTRQTVSKWCAGSATQSGDAIPDAHFLKIGGLFFIDAYLFTLEYGEFEKEVRLLIDRRNKRRMRRPQKICSTNLPINSGKLYGREEEIADLFEAWNQGKKNILQISGPSGIGKSSLINEWLSRMDSDNYWGAEKVYIWSFYQGFGVLRNSEFVGSFIRQALQWFGDADVAQQKSPLVQASRLAQLIKKSRTLLVLDGLQELQYQRGARFGQTHNPAVSLLLRELAMDNPGLCIITSRLKNADLAAIGEPRVGAVDLGNLDQDAAASLLRSYGVHGEPSQIVHAVREHEGLPLSLSILGRHLDVVHDGNLAHFMELAPLLRESGKREQACHLAREYLRLLPDERERKFLYLLCLYGRPASLGELLLVCRFREIDGLTPEILSLNNRELRYTIDALEQSGVIRSSGEWRSPLLDVAPFVRESIALELEENHPQLWKAGNRLLFDYFKGGKSDSRYPGQKKDMLYRAIMYGVRAECRDESLALYFDRVREGKIFISNPGSSYLDQACLRTFFSDPWTHVHSGLSSEESNFDLRFCAAVNLANLGDMEQAIDTSLVCVKWFLTRRKWAKAVSSACLLLSMFLAAGKLSEAVRWAKRIRRKLSRGSDPLTRACGDMLAANVQFLRGKVEKAGELYRQADQVVNAAGPGVEIHVPIASFYFCRYLLESGAASQSLERMVNTFVRRETSSWQLSMDSASTYGGNLSLLGLIFLKQGDLVNARRSLDNHVEILRSTEEWLGLAACLNRRARFFIETEDYQAAKADLKEALGIARRIGALAIEWEAMLDLALLCVRGSRPELGRRYLTKAKKIKGMKAYKFRDSQIQELESKLAA